MRHSDRIVLADGIRLLRNDDGLKIIDLRRGAFFSVDGIGCELLDEAMRSDARLAARLVADRYAVGEGRVAADLEHLVTALRAEGLLASSSISSIPNTSGTSGISGTSSRVARSRGFGRFLFKQSLRPLRQAGALMTFFWVALRALGWEETVAMVQSVHQGLDRARPDEPKLMALDQSVRDAASVHFLNVECKERALCAWHSLRADGCDAALVIGVQFNPFRAHAWVESGGTILTDDAERCAEYVEAARYT